MAPWRAFPTSVATGAPGHRWSIRSRPSLRPTRAGLHTFLAQGRRRTDEAVLFHVIYLPNRLVEWPGVRSASRQEGVTDMPQRKGTRRVYTVETDPKGGWRGAAKGSTRAVAKGDNKAEVVKRTIEVAKKQPKAQVRIKGRNGRIQKERTYPRSSDPKRTPR